LLYLFRRMRNWIKAIFFVVGVVLAIQFVKKPRVVTKKIDNQVKPQRVILKTKNLLPTEFSKLPKWENADVLKSFQAFKNSCKVWSKKNPNDRVGSSMVAVQVKDWLPVCSVAEQIETPTSAEAKAFFENFFRPYHWKSVKKGKFTGYYSPVFQGSLIRSKTFNTPIYEPPKHNLRTFSRSEIYHGALTGKAKVIAWLKNPVDAMALEIEGSGIIALDNGEKYYVSYEEENGHRYRSLAQMAIDAHIFSRAKASIDNIRSYFNRHPEKIAALVANNPSYVFFSKYKTGNINGAQLSELVPKYSIAVDRYYVPMGMPLFLVTQHPINTNGDIKPLQRVMIAQDTGSAIKGPIRGDIYWGAGEKATQIANFMDSMGDYWLLLPRHVTA